LKKRIKKIIGVTIFVLVELFFFIRTDPAAYEMFFMVWGFIAIALLLNNIFIRTEHAPMIGLGGNDSTKYAYLAGAMLENGQEGTKKKRLGGGLLSGDNLVYLFLLLVNAVGYIIHMPK
jgi:hypothetical protein